MRNYVKLILTFTFLTLGQLKAQLEFLSVPADWHFVPREDNNYGILTVSGIVTELSYHTIRSVIRDQDSVVIEDFTAPILHNGEFSFTHNLLCELKTYDLDIYLIDGVAQTCVYKAKGITVGDPYLICGQSNAFASSDPPQGNGFDANYSHLLCKTIGARYGYASPANFPPFTLLQDCQFAKSSCLYEANPNNLTGFVGLLGLKLQHNIRMNNGVPTCLVNGATGGVTIAENMPTTTPSSMTNNNTLYDRVHYKVKWNNLNSYIKAIFWYQGEADAASLENTCDYINKFEQLYHAWKTDYPNVKKIFILQINTGCGGVYNSLLRDKQAKIAEMYPDVEIMSTVGSTTSERANDGCHYTPQGYFKIADNLAQLVSKYIYNVNLYPGNILPPKITRAYYSSANQICLWFDKIVSVQQSTNYQQTTNYNSFNLPITNSFYGENGSVLNIQSVSFNFNQVFLNLPQGSPIHKKISYIPNNFVSANVPYPPVYIGPWITNGANQNIGALTFHNYPITAQTTNNWERVYSNFGSGFIGGFKLNWFDQYYTGDFDGDGTEEILCVQNTGGGGDWMTLVKYNSTTNKWIWLWSNNGNAQSGNGIYLYRDNMIVGDFNGDGKDEIFANGLAYTNSAKLFQFNNGNWLSMWSDNGNMAHGMWPYKMKMYVGDFDGNGNDELLGFDLNPGGWCAQFRFNGSDFVGFWSSNPNHPIFEYKNQLKAGDYNGDGKADLLGMGNNSAKLFLFTNNNWISLWDNGSNPSDFSGWAYPLESTDLILSGNLDSDSKDELLFIQNKANGGWATSMDFNGASWNWNWSTNPINNYAGIDDWAFWEGGAGTRYVLVKAKANEPKYLMAMRLQNCGYLVNMYKPSNPLQNFKHTEFNLNENESEGIANLNQMYIQDDFDVYPNPSKSNISVSSANNKTISSVRILDITGKLVLAKTISVSGSRTIDISSLKAALYIVEIENENHQIARKKLVKE